MESRIEKSLPLTPLSYQILVALADGPRHGYGIIKEIEEGTGRPLKSSTGTLYVAIERLAQNRFIEEEPRRDGRRRLYRLTELGREVAIAETRRLATLLGVASGKKLVGARQLDSLVKAARRQ